MSTAVRGYAGYIGNVGLIGWLYAGLVPRDVENQEPTTEKQERRVQSREPRVKKVRTGNWELGTERQETECVAKTTFC